MRIPALILAVTAGTLLSSSVSAQEDRSQPFKQESKQFADKTTKLQQERIATLKRMTEVETDLLRIGKTPPEAVLEARVLLGEAELDAAQHEADRLIALQGLVEVLKELEETAKARKAAAEVSEAAIL